MNRITPVETGHKIQLPEAWVIEFGLEQVAVLEKTEEGILIRPCPATTRDEVGAERLKIGQQPDFDLSEVSEESVQSTKKDDYNISKFAGMLSDLTPGEMQRFDEAVKRRTLFVDGKIDL